MAPPCASSAHGAALPDAVCPQCPSLLAVVTFLHFLVLFLLTGIVFSKTGGNVAVSRTTPTLYSLLYLLYCISLLVT
jgi:hypothetical protein